VAHADLDRHAPAHAVPDHLGAVDLERVEQAHNPLGEELRVVRAHRLVRVAEAGEVDGDRAVGLRQRGLGGEERHLGAAEPVEHHDGRPLPRLLDRHRAVGGLHAREGEALAVPPPARRGEEAHADVHVLAHVEPPGAVLAEAAGEVGRDAPPGGRGGADGGVGLAARLAQRHGGAVDHRVPLALALDLQPHPRAAAGGVERVGVPALDQRGEALWRCFHGEGRYPGSARPTLSPTQAGFSPPSTSTVNLVTIWYQPPPTSSTAVTSALARTLDPAGTGAGKRTLFHP
jgi:hypothetical protein